MFSGNVGDNPTSGTVISVEYIGLGINGTIQAYYGPHPEVYKFDSTSFVGPIPEGIKEGTKVSFETGWLFSRGLTSKVERILIET